MKKNILALAMLGWIGASQVSAIPGQLAAVDPGAIRRCQERAEQCARVDGEKDGFEYGREWHYQRGYDERYRRELDQWTRKLTEEARENGRRAGRQEGESQGALQGQQDGERQGSQEGRLEGLRDGEQRADSQARSDAREPARLEGQQAARQSDARQQGERQGRTEGDREALEQARAQDYPEGIRLFTAEQFAMPVKTRLKLRFQAHGNRPLNQGGSPVGGSMEVAMQTRTTGQHFQPNSQPAYPSREENEVYRRAYESAYRRAYDRASDSARQDSYARGQREAENQARNDAQRQNYQQEYQQERDRAYREAFDRRYAETRKVAYDLAYGRSFQMASLESYQLHYERLRQQHFAAFRQEAYKETYQLLLETAREQWRTQVRAQKYPAYAKSQNHLGREEARKGFQVRPQRWVSLQPWSQGQALSRGGGDSYIVTAGQEVQFRLLARNFGPTLTPEILLRIDQGQGLIYLPENTFMASQPWPAGSQIQVEEGGVKMGIRSEASGQSLKVTLVLRGPSGQSDEQSFDFQVL